MKKNQLKKNKHLTPFNPLKSMLKYKKHRLYSSQAFVTNRRPIKKNNLNPETSRTNRK